MKKLFGMFLLMCSGASVAFGVISENSLWGAIIGFVLAFAGSIYIGYWKEIK